MKPAPTPSAETQPFWDACQRGELTVQLCEGCGHKQHYPRIMCGQCGSTALSQTPVSGRGTITSFTINRVPVSEAFKDDLPLAVGLITLEEGPVMMANLVDCDIDTLAIGQKVRVTFESRGEITLPQFTPEQS